MRIDIGISDECREKLAAELSRLLADSYTLYLKTHNYHWNVTGPMFQTLHLMFEQQYVELAQAVDAIAERIRALGHPAPGSYAAYARLSSVTDSEQAPPAKEMIAQLAIGHETVIRTARKILPLTAEVHDEATADLVIARLVIHEKTAWMLRSLLEE